METWTKDKSGYADGIGYSGEEERLLMESSSGGLRENVGRTLGDYLKMLGNFVEMLNTYRSKYQNCNKMTFSKLKVFGIQCIMTTIIRISVSTCDDGKLLYQTPRTSQVPTVFQERHHLLPLFELLTHFLVCMSINIVC